jgi:hypothetical protein
VTTLQRETRLADPARAGDRHDRLAPDRLPQLGQLPLPPDQSGGRQGQVAGITRSYLPAAKANQCTRIVADPSRTRVALLPGYPGMPGPRNRRWNRSPSHTRPRWVAGSTIDGLRRHPALRLGNVPMASASMGVLPQMGTPRQATIEAQTGRTAAQYEESRKSQTRPPRRGRRGSSAGYSAAPGHAPRPASATTSLRTAIHGEQSTSWLGVWCVGACGHGTAPDTGRSARHLAGGGQPAEPLRHRPRAADDGAYVAGGLGRAPQH